MQERIKVGEILVKAGVIDEMQLQAALGEQARWGRRLGVTLIKLGFVEERDLVRALASQLNLPVASLEGKRIHPDILALVPAELAEEHSVIPLFTKQENGVGQLFLGMEDPSNLAVLDDLAFRSGMQVRPVMVGPSELAEAIDRAYRRNDVSATPAARPPAAPAAEPAAKVEITDGTAALAAHWTLPESEANHGPENQTEVEAKPAAPLAETATPSRVVEAVIPLEVPLIAEVPVENLIMEAQVPTANPVAAPAAAPRDAAAEEAANNPYDAKTRILVQALAQSMIEAGVITRDEFHTRVSELQVADTEAG
jgi:hypothetical protein